jgi:hypothetical protein
VSAPQAQVWTARLTLAAAVPAVPAVALAFGQALGNAVAAFYTGAVLLLGAAALLGPLAWPAQTRLRSAEVVGVTAVIGWAVALNGYIASVALSWSNPTDPAALALAAAVYLAASIHSFAGGAERMPQTWPIAPVAAAAAWLVASALL